MSRQSYSRLLYDVALLKDILRGGKIQKIRDPDPYTLGLKVRVVGQTYFLILSAHPLSARIGLSLTQPTTLQEPTGLGRWARAHLEGGRIQELTVLAQDRIIALETERGHLYLELIPRLENIYALNPQGDIHKWIGKHPHRMLTLGQKWTPPPQPNTFIHSTDIPSFDWQVNPATLEVAIHSLLEKEEQAADTALHAESIQEKKTMYYSS
jgi:predicted ribosome quality control (RQC) complex YloA/Tae2 family protein